MKPRIALKLAVFGILLGAGGFWLRGHPTLLARAFTLFLLLVAAKGAALLAARRSGKLPPGSGGADSADRPDSRPPGGRPPVLAAAENVKPEPSP